MGKAMILEISSKTKPTSHVLFITNQIGVHKGLDPLVLSELESKLYIPSTPNNSNETHTFMCLGRTGRFGQR